MASGRACMHGECSMCVLRVCCTPTACSKLNPPPSSLISFDQNRTIHAVDPSPQLVKFMHCPVQNFHKHNYAISNETGTFHIENTANAKQTNFKPVHKHGEHGARSAHHTKHVKDHITVPIETLDNLFLNEWKSRAAFLHIDVEGAELMVLQGAKKVIQLHQPVFTIEVHVMEDKVFTAEIISYVESLGYTIYMINEICGFAGDCRNFLCFPPAGKEDIHDSKAHIIRHTFDVAVRHGGLVEVTVKTVFNAYTTALPTVVPWQEWDKFLQKPLHGPKR